MAHAYPMSESLCASSFDYYSQQRNRLKALTGSLEFDPFAAPLISLQKRSHQNGESIFRGFTSILQEEYFTAADHDFSALQSVVENRNEVKLYRCKAAFTLGILSCMRREREEAPEQYRTAVHMATKATTAERNAKVVATLLSPHGTSNGRINGRDSQEAKGNLRKMETSSLLASSGGTTTTPNTQQQQQRMRSNGTALPPARRTTRISNTLSPEIADHLITVGVEVCDACGKTRQEVNKKHIGSMHWLYQGLVLKQDVSEKQWKAGHKVSQTGTISSRRLRATRGVTVCCRVEWSRGPTCRGRSQKGRALDCAHSRW